ncbi:MAG: HIT family protein [Gammaproteobacteria bacterium]|jgi:histidine triad (HIT) family protein|nr:HIT family protein [Gammaproteobacteria bacterium]
MNMIYDPDNIFAKILRGEMPAVKVYEDAATLAFMDVMPQSPGHTLVIPKAPATNIYDLPVEAAAAVMRTVHRLAPAVQAAMRADGIMVCQYNGAAAGQSVFHYHMHIVPRYVGQSLGNHGSGMAPAETLKAYADKISAALAAAGHAD